MNNSSRSKSKFYLVAGLVLIGAAVAIGAIRKSSHEAPPVVAAKPVLVDEAVRNGLANVLPDGVFVEKVQNSPIAALREVAVGGRIVYVTPDGKYMLQGALVELSTKTNLTERSETILHRDALAKIGPERRIEFAASKPKYRVTVFTDVECGYCRKLHSQIAEYNVAGITVDYLLYPREGLGSRAYQTSVNVWCAPDQRSALTAAKLNEPVPEANCANPIADDFALGQRFGFPGTPAVYAPDGTWIGGYLGPADMLAKLDELQAQAH